MITVAKIADLNAGSSPEQKLCLQGARKSGKSQTEHLSRDIGIVCLTEDADSDDRYLDRQPCSYAIARLATDEQTLLQSFETCRLRVCCERVYGLTPFDPRFAKLPDLTRARTAV